jgi:hypothetical protein
MINCAVDELTIIKFRFFGVEDMNIHIVIVSARNLFDSCDFFFFLRRREQRTELGISSSKQHVTRIEKKKKKETR